MLCKRRVSIIRWTASAWSTPACDHKLNFRFSPGKQFGSRNQGLEAVPMPHISTVDDRERMFPKLLGVFVFWIGNSDKGSQSWNDRCRDLGFSRAFVQ